jgi:hypothetical protein
MCCSTIETEWNCVCWHTTDYLNILVFLRNRKKVVSRDRLAGIAISYGLDGPGFESWYDQEIFLFCSRSRPAAVPTQPLIQLLLDLFSGVKRPGRDVNHSPPPSAEVNEWRFTSAPNPRLRAWTGTNLPFTERIRVFQRNDCWIFFPQIEAQVLIYVKPIPLQAWTGP